MRSVRDWLHNFIVHVTLHSHRVFWSFSLSPFMVQYLCIHSRCLNIQGLRKESNTPVHFF